MNSSIHRFTLDLHSALSQVSIPVMLGDTGRTLRINLSDGRKPYVVADGCLARLTIKRPTGTHVEEFCTIEGNATIVYNFGQNENTCAVEGIHNCDITLYGADGNKIGSPKFTMVVSERVSNYDDIVVTDEDRTILEATLAEAASILASVKEYAEQAKAYAEQAKAYAQA